MDRRSLPVEPLDPAAFAPFGDVVAADGQHAYAINAGSARRWHDLMRIDVGDGRPVASIVRASPRALPFDVTMLERHPLGSQAWIPLDPRLRFLVVVASDPASTPRAFIAHGGQGVNYRPGTWHHPLIGLDPGDWLVIDREGAGNNCDECDLASAWRIDLPKR